MESTHRVAGPPTGICKVLRYDYRPLVHLQQRAARTGPNLFKDSVAAYHSFRSAGPGETGDRNIDTIRYPSYVVLDMGLDKRFKLPFEGHSLQFRWETFNVTNTQRFTGLADFEVGLDPQRGVSSPQPSFGNFTAIQGAPRVMQFALRYEF